MRFFCTAIDEYWRCSVEECLWSSIRRIKSSIGSWKRKQSRSLAMEQNMLVTSSVWNIWAVKLFSRSEKPSNYRINHRNWSSPTRSSTFVVMKVRIIMANVARKWIALVLIPPTAWIFPERVCSPLFWSIDCFPFRYAEWIRSYSLRWTSRTSQRG